MKIKEIKIREDDGSYSDAIPVGVDFVNVDTTNGSNLKIDLDNINKNLDNKTNQIDNLKNKDISLQNQINSLASGSPLVANSVEEMTDTSRVYVNTTNGHWYWYDGTNWVAGGVYQATEVSDDTLEKNKTTYYEPNKTENLANYYNIKLNKFINSSGNVATPTLAGEWNLTDYIEVESNTPYLITPTLQNLNNEYQIISWFDSSKQWISNIQVSYTSDTRYYPLQRISPSNAKYVRLTLNSNYKDVMFVKGGVLPKNYVDNYQLNEATINYFKNNFIYKNKTKTENLFNLDDTIYNYYVSNNGLVLSVADGTENYLTNYLSLNYGETLYCNKTMRFVAEFDENYTMIGKLQTGGSYETYTPQNENCKYVRILIFKNLASDLVISKNPITKNFLPYYYTDIPLHSIKKEMLDGANAGARVTNPYPSIISSITGCISNNYGINGSKISLEEKNSMNVRISSITDEPNYFILFGGTNDFEHNVPLGKINDITNTTFYGSLNIIDQYLLNNFVNTKFGIITPIKRELQINDLNLTLEDYRNAEVEIAKLYSIPILDLYYDGQSNPTNETWKLANLPDGLHPNQQYYNNLAIKIKSFIERL